ncbi:MAG: hypothetical protein H6825_14115 [Planctomycetes bacterium]|nr:hypothetical protein [Planctomycetota bacterium]
MPASPTPLRLALLAALALAAPAVPAQDADAARDATSEADGSAGLSGPERTARADAAAARPAERLLHLADGRVLRAEARRVDGRWEVASGDGWQALPGDMVHEVELVSRALSEFRARKLELRKAAPSERVALAAQAMRGGLYTESLELLDEVLAADPDDASARALLDLDGLPIAVPAYDVLDPDQEAVRESLIEYGARSPRPLQELVVRQLDEVPDDERDALLDDLGAALRHRDAGRRWFATLALRRLFPGRALDGLVRSAVLDPLDDVRARAALALRDGGAGVDEVLVPLVAALSSEEGVVRTRAASALGVIGSPLTVAPLATLLASAARASASGDGAWQGPRAFVFVGRQVSYVQDFEPEVAQNAVIAKPVIGVAQEGATLDVRVFGTGGMGGGVTDAGPAREAAAVRGALASITGLEVRDSNAAWLEWWDSDGEAWLAEHGADGAQG